jgi:hypothetical protein
LSIHLHSSCVVSNLALLTNHSPISILTDRPLVRNARKKPSEPHSIDGGDRRRPEASNKHRDQRTRHARLPSPSASIFSNSGPAGPPTGDGVARRNSRVYGVVTRLQPASIGPNGVADTSGLDWIRLPGLGWVGFSFATVRSCEDSTPSIGVPIVATRRGLLVSTVMWSYNYVPLDPFFRTCWWQCVRI